MKEKAIPLNPVLGKHANCTKSFVLLVELQ